MKACKHKKYFIFSFILVLTFVFSYLTNVTQMKEAYAKEIDSVYLSSLSLNKSNIDFDQDTFFYETKVDRDVDEIKVRAKPKSENASVAINGNEVYKDDNYKCVVKLDKGSNLIKIVVTNSDGDSNTYIINVVKGEAEDDPVYLEKLSVNGTELNLDSSKLEYSLSVNSNAKEAEIKAVPEDDNYEVTIDGGVASLSEDYKQTVDLDYDENIILINVKYPKKKYERQYRININKKSQWENKTNQDDIYLEYIKVSDGNIDFKRNKTDYDINVNENVDNIYVTASPDTTDYKVKINDKVVEDSDNYKDFISLNKGKNIIKITVQDLKNNKQRIYTLNIKRGSIDNSEYEDEPNKELNNTNIKVNQWVQTNDGWIFNDSQGKPIRNQWIYNNGTYYYLKDDGIMAAGWNYINNEWYYLNSDGNMKTGWLYDNAYGKWHYLNSSGAMVRNTIIGSYKIGSDGAMI